MANHAARLEMGKKTQAHVLALPIPFQGHINPMLQVAHRLAAEGVAVSFITTPHFHSRIASSIQSILDCAGNPRIRLISLSNACLPPPDLRVPDSMALQFRVFTDIMPKEVEDVICSMQKHDSALPVTCLLSDIGIPFAQRLADKFSIARMVLWHQSVASFCYHRAIAQGFQIPTDGLAMVDNIPGVPAHTASKVPIVFRREIVGNEIVDFLVKPLERVNGALPVVCNALEDLEPEALEVARGQGWNVLCIGPLLLPSARAEEEHMCLKWLDAHEPASVLYIAFGSLVTLEEAEFTELALGIEASQQSFLWSLRPNMITGDPDSFIEAFKKRTELRGFVLPWVPQLEVLSHSSIGGFLTHCGWNSSLESMCRGVPMIGRPISGEQQFNAVCLADSWKVCLAMEGELHRNEVERNVRALFAGPQAEELRCAAQRMRDLVAVSEKGSSMSNFKLLLKLITEGTESGA